jgi:hypothetical protein
MPGAGRYQWQWIGKPPIYWTIIFGIAMVEFAVGWVLTATLPRWAAATPDAAHPVELRMKFGHIYYLGLRIGWFLNNDLWIFFGLLGLLALIMVLHHHKLERVR